MRVLDHHRVDMASGRWWFEPGKGAWLFASWEWVDLHLDAELMGWR